MQKHKTSTIILDYVTGLSISNDYNAILMIVDYLTKEKHYILCNTDKNGITIIVIT